MVKEGKGAGGTKEKLGKTNSGLRGTKLWGERKSAELLQGTERR